jgi:periplasmic divalent cation tolerance protein
MSRIVSVYATFANDEEARRIARTLVEERLTACVNILGACRSIYRWEGRIEEADEVSAIFKTTADTAAALVERLCALHSYDVPAAVVWTVESAAPGYAHWVGQEVQGI